MPGGIPRLQATPFSPFSSVFFIFPLLHSPFLRCKVYQKKELDMFTVCPHCGTEFEVEKEWAGEQTQCLSCGMKFIISKKSEPVLKPVLKPVSHQKKRSNHRTWQKRYSPVLFRFPCLLFSLVSSISDVPKNRCGYRDIALLGSTHFRSKICHYC